MSKLSKEEVEAYLKFSALCKKLEKMPIKKAKIIKLNTSSNKNQYYENYGKKIEFYWFRNFY